MRKSGVRSFSVSQKNEPFLMEEIKSLFNSQNSVRKTKGDVYIFEIYKFDTLMEIALFLEKNPLIGEKRESYIRFFNK